MTALHYGVPVKWEIAPELEFLLEVLEAFKTPKAPEEKAEVRLGEEVRGGEWGFSLPSGTSPSEARKRLGYWVRWRFGFRARVPVLHAGGVLGRAGAVVLMGPQGSGKTTLTRLLTEKGFPYLGEETVSLQNGLIHPELPTELWPVKPAPPSPPSALVFLRFSPAGKTSLRPLEPAEAAARLVECALNARLEAFAPALQLVGLVRELRYGSPEEALDALEPLL